MGAGTAEEGRRGEGTAGGGADGASPVRGFDAESRRVDFLAMFLPPGPTVRPDQLADKSLSRYGQVRSFAGSG